MTKSNPTIKTQKEILSVIERSPTPMSITAIAFSAKKNLNAVKETVDFLEKLGLLTKIITSGNTTVIFPIKKSEQQTEQNHIKNLLSLEGTKVSEGG